MTALVDTLGMLGLGPGLTSRTNVVVDKVA